MSFFKILFKNNINTKTKIPFPFIDIYYFQWNKLIKTQIHDHSSRGCYLLLFKGEMEEKIYNSKLEYITTNHHCAPSISFINDKKGYHSVRPLKVSRSIHFYYPKNHITKYYN